MEDARMHHKDLLACMLDFKSAFNSVDHSRLFKTLQAHGVPEDAMAIIIDLHDGASTSILSKFGSTQPVSLRRGTIQGDSLSPLLFILFLGPLLRWLQVGDRGYRCASVQPPCCHYANCLAAADDLALLSEDVLQMQKQLCKVQAFADGTGMQLAPAKCEASAVLWGTHAAYPDVLPCNFSVIEPLLMQLRVGGSPLRCIDPTTSVRYLGPIKL